AGFGRSSGPGGAEGQLERGQAGAEAHGLVHPAVGGEVALEARHVLTKHKVAPAEHRLHGRREGGLEGPGLGSQVDKRDVVVGRAVLAQARLPGRPRGHAGHYLDRTELAGLPRWCVCPPPPGLQYAAPALWLTPAGTARSRMETCLILSLVPCRSHSDQDAAQARGTATDFEVCEKWVRECSARKSSFRRCSWSVSLPRAPCR